MKLFRKVIAISLLSISLLYNQVNTEAMRDNSLLPGIHHKLELDFAYVSGITEIFNLNGTYRADYLSNSNLHGFFVWKYDRAFEKSMYTFLTAYSMKQFPLLKGPTASGKHVLLQEVARILAQNLMIRPVSPMISPSRIIQVSTL